MATNGDIPAPRDYKGVMVSSTFKDLEALRQVLIRIIETHGFKAVAMEHDSAKPGVDVVRSSIQMVRDCSAYVGIISRRYGQTPVCPTKNPHCLSITELEFDEAVRLGRPILLFIMEKSYPVGEDGVELDSQMREKLAAFRERAKNMGPDSRLQRVYATFCNAEEFKDKAGLSIAGLRLEMVKPDPEPVLPIIPLPPPANDLPPAPPAFHSEPPYIGSHDFVGRQHQLDIINDWASPADSHPVLLFEAIGGSGKSMLTWEWTTKHATRTRGDWAGRFWYSFYEKGAVMADFCRRALAYMTHRPYEDFVKMKTLELAEQLVQQLRARPWLLVLDGLERVLVAYNRFDAAQARDEEANAPTDQISHRDPCSAIRPEDDDLLRLLASAAPSKILVSSRLIPRILLNPASQPIAGVLRERLPGLRPADAEALFRACGVTGDSQAIQTYLKTHCDCHPLVTGVLAGIVCNYLPDRGNFDAWAADRREAEKLNFADLDLVQKRNHILGAALDDLPERSRELLSTLALVSESVDFPTLAALNPHLPPEPEEVGKPTDPELLEYRWKRFSDAEKEEARQEYQAGVQRRKEYEQAVKDRLASREYRTAPDELAKTIADLEKRGLLQYDRQQKHYDLHPVVRGVAAGGLHADQKGKFGQRVVDHFSRQTHNPYEEAETLEDVRAGLQVVRAFLQMGRFQEAADAFLGDLSRAMLFNLESHAEAIAILRPFFPDGWGKLPRGIGKEQAEALANQAGISLSAVGDIDGALAAEAAALVSCMRSATPIAPVLRIRISNIALSYWRENRISLYARLVSCELAVATIDAEEYPGDLFRARLSTLEALVDLGSRDEAEAMWQLLDPMGRDWRRNIYRPGYAEHAYARFRFQCGNLEEEHLACAEKLASDGRNRQSLRNLHRLRGEWRLGQENWASAAESLHEAVRMARASGIVDAASETMLALAKFHLGQLAEPRHEAERLAALKEPSHRMLAELWLAIGDGDQAKKHALAACKWAWADGEPYVFRYELDRSRELLQRLGVPVPDLPPYNPAKDEKLPWEDELDAVIEKLKAQKEAKDRAKGKKP